MRFTSTQVKLKSIQVKGKMIKLSWKKVPSADGYVIQYGTKANFKGAKKLTVKKKTSANIKKLKKGKTYFVRVKAYQNVDGKKIYTKNSIKKKVHTRR